MNWQGAAGSGQIPGKRAEQQDALALGTLVLADGRNLPLAVVADGMGGHDGGALAAHVAIDAFLHHCSLGSEAGIAETLDAALLAANRAIACEAREAPHLRDMGCTLVAAVPDGQVLHHVSVGDSPLWRVADARLYRINADHSMTPVVDAAVARGEMREEEAQRHRSGLRSALTGKPIALVDSGSTALLPGDGVILASDGIFTLADPEIAAIAQAALGGACQDGVDRLLDSVEEHAPADQDNCTLVLFRIEGAGVAVARRRWPGLGALLAIAGGLGLAALAAWQIAAQLAADQPRPVAIRQASPAAAPRPAPALLAPPAIARPDPQGEAYKDKPRAIPPASRSAPAASLKAAPPVTPKPKRTPGKAPAPR